MIACSRRSRPRHCFSGLPTHSNCSIAFPKRAAIDGSTTFSRSPPSMPHRIVPSGPANKATNKPRRCTLVSVLMVLAGLVIGAIAMLIANQLRSRNENPQPPQLDHSLVEATRAETARAEAARAQTARLEAARAEAQAQLEEAKTKAELLLKEAELQAKALAEIGR